MNRKFALSMGGAAFAIALAALAAVFFFASGSSSAQEGGNGGPTDSESLLAIAIGQLEEEEGEYATVDLRAHDRGRVGGNLRFFSKEYGYYNGGVKTLTCDDGVIAVSGGGGLILPDGTKKAVQYTAMFDTATGESSITVKGAHGLQYTMAGEMDGLVWCGDPQDEPVIAAP